MSGHIKPLVLVGVTAVILLVGVIVLRRDPDGEGRNEPPYAPPVVARRDSSPPAIGDDPSKLQDLLGLVDASKDAVRGSWGFDGGALLTSSVQWGRLQIPCVPPAEYDLELEVERKSGGNSLNIGLVADGRQFLVVLDGWEEGKWAGLDIVNEKPFFQNETSRPGRVLKKGQVHRVVCSVRKDGVRVDVNAQRLLESKVAPRLYSLHESWRVPDPRALLIGSWESVFSIRKMILRPVAGTLKPLPR